MVAFLPPVLYGPGFAASSPYLNGLEMPICWDFLVVLDHTECLPAQHLEIGYNCTLGWTRFVCGELLNIGSAKEMTVGDQEH